jgi:DNA-binding MarR family transcriptional regulator
MHISADTARPNQPIGYWLKHLDRLIDADFDRALGAGQLSRRHWQVLNLLARQPARPADLRAALAPFLADTPQAQTAVTSDLIGRGWVADDDGRLHLTDTGREAHAAILAEVTGTRRKIVDGISDDEYLATVDVLRRMVANLEG